MGLLSRRGALASGSCGLVLVVSGCGGLVPTSEPLQTVYVTSTVTTVSPGPVGPGGAEGPDTAQLTVPPVADPRPGGMDLSGVIDGVPSPVGIAVAGVGGRSEVQTAGVVQSGAAWSTIKVPLAVAVARVSPASLESASTAITASDNAAAERLWDALGGGASSAAGIGAVLADGGDSTTRVPTVRTRAEYSIFGQTRWPLVDQARFGSLLPCIGSSARVLDLMGRVSPDQSWGLGRIPGARFKGGWGPGESGGYLVRQFGIVPAAGGEVAVAIAVESASFDQGVGTLSAVADALALRLPSLQGEQC
ncbi:hypothetical protein GCM10009831_17970 [Dietzia cercidiphylli]|uniref:Secreted protein n=1 Tax=Dietzia cercidiphylli TaxID=498199 RepID=A0ABN2INM5_9ACTN